MPVDPHTGVVVWIHGPDPVLHHTLAQPWSAHFRALDWAHTHTLHVQQAHDWLDAMPTVNAPDLFAAQSWVVWHITRWHASLLQAAQTCLPQRLEHISWLIHTPTLPPAHLQRLAQTATCTWCPAKTPYGSAWHTWLQDVIQSFQLDMPSDAYRWLSEHTYPHTVWAYQAVQHLSLHSVSWTLQSIQSMLQDDPPMQTMDLQRAVFRGDRLSAHRLLQRAMRQAVPLSWLVWSIGQPLQHIQALQMGARTPAHARWRTWAHRWSSAQLAHLLETAAEIDACLKSQQEPQGQLQLTQWIEEVTELCH